MRRRWWSADRRGDGRLKAEFRLWDVLAGKQLAGEQFCHGPRTAGNRPSDRGRDLREDHGRGGCCFDTRIVFVDKSGPKDKRMKRLAIMDQDGFNVRLLTTGQNLVLTPHSAPRPRRSPTPRIEGDDPKVYLLNIETGQKEIVGTFPGMTFAPRFSPTDSGSS